MLTRNSPCAAMTVLIWLLFPVHGCRSGRSLSEPQSADSEPSPRSAYRVNSQRTLVTGRQPIVCRSHPTKDLAHRSPQKKWRSDRQLPVAANLDLSDAARPHLELTCVANMTPALRRPGCDGILPTDYGEQCSCLMPLGPETISSRLPSTQSALTLNVDRLSRRRNEWPSGLETRQRGSCRSPSARHPGKRRIAGGLAMRFVDFIRRVVRWTGWAFLIASMHRSCRCGRPRCRQCGRRCNG